TFLGMNGVIWVFNQIGNFFAWFFSLFDPPEMDGSLPEMAPQEQIEIDEIQEEIGLSLNIEWIVAIVGALVLIVLILIFGKFLKNARPVKKSRPVTKTTKFRWSIFKEKYIQFMLRLKITFRKKFA